MSSKPSLTAPAILHAPQARKAADARNYRQGVEASEIWGNDPLYAEPASPAAEKASQTHRTTASQAAPDIWGDDSIYKESEAILSPEVRVRVEIKSRLKDELKSTTLPNLQRFESAGPGANKATDLFREIGRQVADDLRGAGQRNHDRFISRMQRDIQPEDEAQMLGAFNNSVEGIRKERDKSLFKALKEGFKAEPGAVENPDHPLWQLAQEVGLKLTDKQLGSLRALAELSAS
jgi:hypothetical protein